MFLPHVQGISFAKHLLPWSVQYFRNLLLNLRLLAVVFLDKKLFYISVFLLKGLSGSRLKKRDVENNVRKVKYFYIGASMEKTGKRLTKEKKLIFCRSSRKPLGKHTSAQQLTCKRSSC